MASTDICKQVKIAGTVNPFTASRHDCEVPAGVTLQDAVERYVRHIAAKEGRKECHVARLLKYCNVFVNNVSVKPEEWQSFIISADDEIICNIAPLGSGGSEGKNPLRTLLTIGLMVGAMAVSGGVGGIFAGLAASAGPPTMGALMGAKILGGLAAAAVGVVGTLAINAIFPVVPKDTNNDTANDSTFQISGGRNQFKPWESVPVLLGKMRVAPLFAVQPYTFGVDDDQFWFSVFTWGYSDELIVYENTLKIGETLISNFNDSMLQIPKILHPGETTDIYEGSVIEQAVSASLDELGADQWIVRTTTGEVDEFSVDIAFPGGLYRMDDNNKIQSYAVRIDVGYKLQSESNFTSVFDDTLIPEKIITAPTYGLIVSNPTANYHDTYIFFDKASSSIISRSGYNMAITPSDLQTILYRIRVGNNTIDVLDQRPADMRNGFNLSIYRDGGINSGQWLVSSGRYTFPGWEIIDKKNTTIIRTKRKAVSRGVYDVRVRRITAKSTNIKVADFAQWQVLRCKQNTNAINFPYPVAITEMRVQANSQLNGSVDTFTGVVANVIPDWNEATQSWRNNETSNPASLIRYVLTGAPNERRVTADQIDNDSFVAFWRHCNTNKFTYNKFVQAAVDILELIKEIAAAGRAFVVQPDGKYAIVIDTVKPAPVQHFTPANSWGFSTTKTFPNLPHAFRVAFCNEENDYQNDERIVYDDGYNESNATLFESIEISGVTNPAQIYKLAREQMRAARLRPEVHTLNVDMEHLIAGRRDWVRVSHDVLMVGLAYGRIKDVIGDGNNITGVVIENTSPMAEGRDYGITIRSSRTAGIIDRQIITEPGEQYTLTFINPISADIAAGDLYTFGENGKTTEDYIISHIEPLEGLNAKITLIAYAPEIYAEEAPPPFIPNVNTVINPQLLTPFAPILTVHSLKETLALRGNEAVTVITFSWLPPINSPIAVQEYQVQYRPQNGSWVDGGFHPQTATDLTGLAQGTYNFRVRSVSRYGAVSGWVVLENRQIFGDTLPPADVTGLATFYNDNRLRLTWNAVNDVRQIFYEVRKGNAWYSGQTVYRGVLNEYALLSDGRYWVKAYTRSGLYSNNAISIDVVASGGIHANVVIEEHENPDWLGEKINFYLVEETGVLRLDGESLYGYYTIPENVRQLSAATECNITLSYSANGYRSDDIYAYEDIYAVSDIYSLANGGYTVAPKIKYLDDADNWSDWEPFRAGAYIGKAFLLRLSADISDEEIYLILDSFSYIIDVPDRLEVAQITIPDATAADGYLWEFDPAFNMSPSVIGSVVQQSAADGNKILSIDKASVNENEARIYITKPDGTRIGGVANVYAQGY